MRPRGNGPRKQLLTLCGRPITRRGVTLLELLVVLVLLAMLAGVVGLTLHTARPVSGLTPTAARLAALRDSAVRTGRAVTMEIATRSGRRSATAYPDGRVVADPLFGVNLLTGAPSSRAAAVAPAAPARAP